jgi:hypothetical protein
VCENNGILFFVNYNNCSTMKPAIREQNLCLDECHHFPVEQASNV